MDAVFDFVLVGPSPVREPARRPGGRPSTLRNEASADSGNPAACPESDEELLRRYRGGDQQAFRRLYERHRGALIRFVRRTAFNLADADEVVQETWMAVILGRERYVANARFVTYLFSIARRRGADRWRRRGRRLELEDDGMLEAATMPESAQPDSLLGAEAFATAMAASVRALPPLQREVFLLRAETDLTLEELAQVVGTNRETVKSRLRYAQNRLRLALEEWT